MLVMRRSKGNLQSGGQASNRICTWWMNSLKQEGLQMVVPADGRVQRKALEVMP